MKHGSASVGKHAAPQSRILPSSDPPTRESTAQLGRQVEAQSHQPGREGREKAGIPKAFSGLES